MRTPGRRVESTLQRRLLQRILPALVATSLTVSISSGAITYMSVRHAILDRGTQSIMALALSTAEPLWSLRYEAVELLLKSAAIDGDVAALRVTDDSRTLVAMAGPGPSEWATHVTRRVPIVLVREHLSETIGSIELQLTLQRAVRGALRDLLLGLVTTLASTLALLASVVMASRKLLLRPLSHIASIMQQSRADGARYRIHLNDADDEFQSIVESYNGMQDRLEADEVERQTLAKRLDTALTHMAQGIVMYSPEGELLLVNDRCAEMLGLPPGALRSGMSQREAVGLAANHGLLPEAEVDALCRRRLDLAARRGSARMLLQVPGHRTLAVCHESLPDGGWVTTYEDVTERRRSDERAAFLARHDALTGLTNRVAFGEKLDAAVAGLARGGEFAVLCLDLDRFKAVNDTLGHSAGDALLRQVTDRLLACVRETDTVARLGGDEFAILQTMTADDDAAAELARRLISVIGAPYDLGGHQVSIGTSVGIARAPQDGALGATLLKNADLALYRAKADGGGTFRYFEVEMDLRLQARRRLEADLRRALPEGELELYYQPLVDTSTECVVSFEALLRWHHPERGMVPPDAFISLAEETGLILDIGNWVLRQACADAATWPPHISVAVNLSPVQFRRPGLLDAVERALVASGLSPTRLELEITEAVLLKETTTTLSTLNALRGLGVRIAMDDFGTGYSLLSNLRRFSFDKIKIDRSFVGELSTQAEAAAIVRAVAALGRSLGMRTTAEGVETAEQLARLLHDGCTEAQGYFFSKPRPAREVRGLIARLDGRAAERGSPELVISARDEHGSYRGDNY